MHKGIAIPMEHTWNLQQKSHLKYSEWLQRTYTGNILTAVFNISLAGDQEDGFNSQFEAPALKSVKNLEMQASNEQLMKLGRSLVQHKVALVICQKCVYPQLRSMLEANVSGIIMYVFIVWL